MTLEEIRAAKEAAETDIRIRLLEFQKLTGMCPVGLSHRSLDATTLYSARPERHVGTVTIELEPI